MIVKRRKNGKFSLIGIALVVTFFLDMFAVDFLRWFASWAVPFAKWLRPFLDLLS